MFLALELPYIGGSATSLKDIFGGANFFPCPTAIGARGVVPLVLVLYVSTMHLFHPKNVFFGRYGPH